MKKQLPDTPWHIGPPKMKESDHRRLNKWCVHYDSSFCTEPKSGCYMLRCAGSSHCKFYAEDEKASKKIERDNRTQMEIDAENRRRYVQTLKPQMQALVSSLDDRRYQSVQSLTKCYVCGRKLLELGKNRKQCTLCHMEYIDQINWLTDNKAMDNRFVYVMGREKPVTSSESHKTDMCQFCNSNEICLDNNSPLFQKRCYPGYCKKTKQLKANKFNGVKCIQLSSIVVHDMPSPRQCKIDCAVEEIRRDGGLTTPIYIGLYGDKYLLKEGYIRYLAARQCGLTSIPATLEWKCVKKK